MRILVPVLVLAALVSAAPDGWHPTLEKGVEAARRSGKPLFIATMWGQGT